MYVSPQTLDLHLGQLKRRFELVHLDDWLRSARQEAPLPKLACAITFDDGWQDNCEFALPVLVRHGAPATIFLVSTSIGSSQRFWPNRLMSLLRKAHADPDSVEFPPPLQRLVEPALADARSRGELRAEVADRVVVGAKEFGEGRIRELVAETERSCGGPTAVREILNAQEIAEMATTGLIRFGSHTATHFRLGGAISRQELEREIVFSRDELRSICGQSIDIFCYPNGETSPAAIELARRHYLGAVTTRKGWHTMGADPYLVRRIGMHEDISDTRESFLACASGWL